MVAGVIPVVYSFFTPSGLLDLDAHERQIAWTRGGGAAGVALFGLASEGGALSPVERRAVLSHTCENLAPTDTLLVTVRPDDDIQDLSRCAVEHRDRVGLIVQVGKDPSLSIDQIDKLLLDSALAERVDLGLQLAPGLIDTAFSAGALNAHPALLARLRFLKAEYNSIVLSAHLSSLDKPLSLLVGRHGQNLIDYLRIGAVGVIPGTEMTMALRPILDAWTEGRRDEAIRAYCGVAPYVDFAMQDLDTVIDVGRAITAQALQLNRGLRRVPSGLDAHALERAIDTWWPFWKSMYGN
jgi:2-keto-3-deoxy-L-arabinonate dehydratase